MSRTRSDLPSVSVKRPLLASVMNLLIIIAGLAALLSVEVRELPDVDRPRATITAQLPGAAPETMDAEVTRILESAAARVSGVREIDSSSEENNTRIVVSFNPGVDLDTAAADLREAVSQVERDLPERVEQVNVVKADEDSEPVMELAVLADPFDEQALTELIEDEIQPEIQAVEGVAAVNLFGARERQLRVALDPLRLSRFGLTVSDVVEAVSQAPYDVPAGSFRSQDQQLIVRAEATSATPEEVEDIIVSGDTRVGDVADAYFAPADAENFTRLNGRPIIGLGVVRQAGSNTIEISNAVKERVEALNDRFEGEPEIVVTSDNAVFIEQSVREVVTSLGLAVVIVVLTLWLFFGSLRATLIPAAAIPTALIGALAGIWLMGFSINLLTLLALVLASGLIVDDAIVVIENIQRLQTMGYKRRAAALLGARQVFFAVIATTAVLISVFVPISFLPSTAGRLFREFGVTLALAVAISSFVALTLVPALAARLTMIADPDKRRGPLQRAGGWLSGRYERALAFSLNRPVLIAGAVGAAALGAVLVFFSIERELVPEEDRGTVSIFASGPDGVGVDYMDRQSAHVERVLQPYLDDGVIESVFMIVGRYDPNRLLVTATLADWSEREISQQEIIAELEEPLDAIPGLRASAFGRGSLDVGGGGNREGLEVALTGSNYPDIFEAGRALQNAIEADSDILSNPELSYQPTQPQLSIRIDRRRAADLGVSLDELSTTLRAMVDGEDVVDLNVEDRAVPIYVESALGAVSSPSDLRNLYVRTEAGALIPVSTLVEIVEEGTAAELDRTEQRRAIELEADIASDVALADAIAEMDRIAADTVPETIDMIYGGEAEALAETTRDIILTYVFAFIIVALVLIAQFESLTSPLVIILTVPFGLAAAIYAMAITGTSFNIFSQIGLILLIGLMAKNGILVVEFADQLRSEGKSVREAIETAANIRLRPIVMTVLSTVLGALPLILSGGAGAESRAAIGWVVFAGLGVAGLFTLFLTPIAYLGIARLSQPRAAQQKALDEEIEEARGKGLDGETAPAE